MNLSDEKLWWKEKTYRSFAKQSCSLSNKKYNEIIMACSHAINKTKDEIKLYKHKDKKVLGFVRELQECWMDKRPG